MPPGSFRRQEDPCAQEQREDATDGMEGAKHCRTSRKRRKPIRTPRPARRDHQPEAEKQLAIHVPAQAPQAQGGGRQDGNDRTSTRWVAVLEKITSP